MIRWEESRRREGVGFGLESVGFVLMITTDARRCVSEKSVVFTCGTLRYRLQLDRKGAYINESIAVIILQEVYETSATRGTSFNSSRSWRR